MTGRSWYIDPNREPAAGLYEIVRPLNAEWQTIWTSPQLDAVRAAELSQVMVDAPVGPPGRPPGRPSARACGHWFFFRCELAEAWGACLNLGTESEHEWVWGAFLRPVESSIQPVACTEATCPARDMLSPWFRHRCGLEV